MNALFRKTLVIATAAVVCFALALLICRIALWQLPRLEGAINSALAGQGIVVGGLDGRWNGVNPSVYADSLKFPSGKATGVDFELDVLESLRRKQLVARRLTVADAHVAFEKTPTGWRLRGVSGSGDFDLRPLLTYSDQVWLRGRIGLYESTARSEIQLESMVINRDGNHRFHVGVQTDASCSGCVLTIDGDFDDDGPGAIRIAGTSIMLDDDLLDLAGAAALFPDAVAKHVAMDLTGDWRRATDGGEHLRLHLAANVHGLPGADARVTLEAAAWYDGDRGYRGRIESLSLESQDAVFRLADGGGFRVRPSTREGALWLPAFSVDALARPLGRALGADEGIGRHLARLAPRARISAFGVHFDAQGIAFHGAASAAAVQGHKGVPEIAGAAFSFGGNGYAARFHSDSRDVLLAFPAYLPAYATHDMATGTFTLVHGDGYFGLRGNDVVIRKDTMQAVGGIALSRRAGELHSEVIADGRVGRADVETAREYLPTTLAPRLRDWLRKSVLAGELFDAHMVYQGRTTINDNLPWRRFDMTAGFADATIDYDPDWPMATTVSGQFTLTPRDTRLRGEGHAFGVQVRDLQLHIAHQRGNADPIATAVLQFRCDTTVSRVFDFARTTPIHRDLPFLSDTWSGDGPVGVAADVRIPLGRRPLAAGDVRADFHFDDANLDLSDIGLQLDAIHDSVRYEFPTHLASDGLRATLFSAPATIAIVSDDDTVRFDLTGSATAQDAYRLVDIEDPGIAQGRFDFDAAVTIFPAADRAMELEVTSDLTGLAVRLPAPLAKTPDDVQPISATMQFLDTHVAVAARYGDSDGWLHTADGSIRAGAVGVGTSLPMVDAADGRVVLSGGVHEIDAQTMAALLAPAADGERPFAWELRRFSVGKMAIDELQINDAEIDGIFGGDEVSFAIESTELTGTVARSGDAPWQVKLTELKLPATDAEDDPISEAAMDRLLAADVELDHVFVGDEDYGSLKFGLRPDAEGVTLTDIVADVRGLRIVSRGEVHWSRAGETRFTGEVSATNLQNVMPLWGFAASVESESFHADGKVRWPGSPLNFELAHLSGDAQLRVANGRFLDVVRGATPILSLINFSTIAKRMNLDFSDVFGSGVSFESASAQMAVDDGLARFTEVAEIVGTGSIFRLVGTIDLDSGMLDNEMVVTLPLHSSLPWYAAFLALTNPAGAAAVVVGRQVFERQIKRLTSGKYRIRGTYEEPDVEFVGIFADDVNVVPGVEDGADSDGASEDPVSSSGQSGPMGFESTAAPLDSATRPHR